MVSSSKIVTLEIRQQKLSHICYFLCVTFFWKNTIVERLNLKFGEFNDNHNALFPVHFLSQLSLSLA